MDHDPDVLARRAASFGSVAWRYDQARQDYPSEAVHDLLGGAPRDVLDIGAGTGKLTRVVASAGHRVIAADPSPQMLAGFAGLQLRSYPHEAVIDVAGFVDLARSRSHVAIMQDAERQRVLEEVRRLGETLADGAGRITIPLRCDVWHTNRG